MNSNLSITSSDWLKQSTHKLKVVGDTSARLDAMILLEDELKIDRIKLLSSDINISNSSLSNLNTMLNRRIKHEPIAYIRGFTEFYGNNFLVNKNVLVPRPESESFINLFANIYDNSDINSVLDIGCGSGCIGLSLKLTYPKIVVQLTDVSLSALNVAKLNANRLKVEAKFKVTSLLQDLNNDYDVIVANLPYVPTELKTNEDTKFEPYIAIYSGEDGLELYREMWNQIITYKHKPKYLLTESLLGQHNKLIKLAGDAGYTHVTSENLVQVFKHSPKD